MKLTDDLKDSFKYGKYRLHVNMAFDNVLYLFEMLQDSDLMDDEKIIIGLDMLLNDYEKVEGASFQEQQALFLYIMKDFVGVDLTEEVEPSKKIMDFTEDAERIYASFLYDYNIDLFKEKGKMHWKKFNILLSELSEDSPFMRVINIRTMEIPPQNQHNSKERQKIIKAKQHYALEQPEGLKESGFDNAASFLKRK